MSATLEGGMNQLCKVCGEPAAGFHFGAFTCEGCKSFFGRTYNNLSSISECKNNGQCIINKKNRTACKACRLRKCLLVGMSKSGSRYGRRSNWFKIHCLLQEQQQHHHHQQQQQQQQQQVGGNIMLRPHPYLPLFRNPSEARSSESDSGASSADPEDGMMPSASSPSSSTVSSKKLPSPLSESECFLRRYHLPIHQIPLSPASAPSISPRWMPPLIPDVWLRGADAAPEQNEPIDLSVKQFHTSMKNEAEKEGRPLDLTLDRDHEILSN